MELLQFDFLRHALATGILASIACGVVGSYVVIKRIVFISGGISHTAYGGIGLGYFLGINPILGAVFFTVISALGMGILVERTRQREDTLIGIIWAVGMALGVIFVKLSPGYTTDLMSYLFGNILAVPFQDLILISILDAIIVAVVWFYFEELKAVAFDEEFAQVAGIPTRFFNLLLLLLIALTVVVMIRAVGILLVIALMSIPPAIAGQSSKSLKEMMVLAIILGIVFNSGGIILSYFFDLPSGATIILLAAAGFIISTASRQRFG